MKLRKNRDSQNELGEPPTRRDMFSFLRRSPLSKRGAARPKNLDRIVRHILNESQESRRHNVERLKGLREIMARNWIFTRSMDRNGPYVDTADDVNIHTSVIASAEVYAAARGNELDVAAKPTTFTAAVDERLASSAETQSIRRRRRYNE